jgi:transposase
MALYVGVDVGKQTLAVALGADEASVLDMGNFANRVQGIERLANAVEQVAQGQPLHLVVEPTGSYHLSLVAAAYARGWQVSLPNPQRVREWANGLGRRAKTDTLDARTLARYGLHCQPSAQRPLPAEVAELEQLLRRKEDLEHMLQQERQRQATLGPQPTAVNESLKQMREALEQALREIEAAVEALLRQQPKLAQQRRQLCSVPGIGVRNVLHILVLLYRWEAYTAGQGTVKGLTAYVGLDPVPYQSGTSIHKRSSISKMGNTSMRRRFYLSALGATNARSSPLVIFYKRLLAHAKPKMVALLACARKILVWAWAVFRSGASFDPARALPAGFAS